MPSRHAIRPAARQRRRQDAEIVGAEVSFQSLCGMQSDGTGTNRLAPFAEVAMRPNGTLRPKVRTAVCPHPEEADMDPAKEVKPYVKRNKNDPADAEAICEAVRRPTMRFVGAKSLRHAHVEPRTGR